MTVLQDLSSQFSFLLIDLYREGAYTSSFSPEDRLLAGHLCFKLHLTPLPSLPPSGCLCLFASMCLSIRVCLSVCVCVCSGPVNAFRPDSGRADIKAWQKKVKETNRYPRRDDCQLDTSSTSRLRLRQSSCCCCVDPLLSPALYFHCLECISAIAYPCTVSSSAPAT